MKIAIVDDRPEEANILKEMLLMEWERLSYTNITTDIYSSGELFLESFSPGQYGLILLDIYMKGMSGVDLARAIRRLDEDSAIAFCTTSNEFASESFELGLFYYIRKPVTREQISTMLKRLDLKHQEHKRSILLPDGSKVLIRNLLYTRYFQRWVTIYTDTDEKRFRMTQSEVAEMLSPFDNFLRVGQSEIINLDRVTRIASGDFIMNNGNAVTIPRRLLKSAKETYTQYRFKKSIAEDEF